MHHDIILSTINAKWIHPSLGLRLLKANLGPAEERCKIVEFALRQPLEEKVNAIMAARPFILGLSVAIWNHTASTELLEELKKQWKNRAAFEAEISGNRDIKSMRPYIVLGGPEVSYLPPNAAIFRYADFIVRGEGEHAFRQICEQILSGCESPYHNYPVHQVDIHTIKTAYHLYSTEDLCRKLIYVESSRGCPFNCGFCLSAIKTEVPGLEKAGSPNTQTHNQVRFFPVDQFLAEMGVLISRGARTFKFLDRTFNLDIKRALKILEFFLDKIDEQKNILPVPFVVHFEMIPSCFPRELRECLYRFPPGTLRLEIGIQTLNAEVSAIVCRPCNPEKELAALRFLREKTNAIIHADLIAGLPGEDLVSFGTGFDRLWNALSPRAGETEQGCTAGQELHAESGAAHPRSEIQLGILKLLPGAPIARLSENFGMRYNLSPPYEIMETAALGAHDLDRIKNFARFWELIVNRGLVNNTALETPVFEKFMALSDSLFTHFGRNWGIAKNELCTELDKRHFTGKI